MNYDGIIAELPFGLAGTHAHENRLLSGPTELLDAQGVTFEDHHIHKEAGVLNLDAAGIGQSPALTWTPSAYRYFFDAGIVTLQGTTPIAFTRSIGTASSTHTKVSSQALTVPTSAIPVGSLVAVVVSFSLGAGGGPVTSFGSLADTRGNLWVPGGDFRTNSGDTAVGIALFLSKITTQIQIGDSITWTSGSGPVLVALVAAEFTGVNSSTVDQKGYSGGGLAASPAAPGEIDSGSATVTAGTFTVVPQLLLSWVCLQGFFGDNASVATVSFGSGFTQTASATFGTTLTGEDPDVRIALGYRIDTSSPIIIAIQDWYSGFRIASGGTFKAATTSGSATVTGSGSTLWQSGTEAQRIFNGDTILLYNGTDMEARIVLSVASDTSLTTTEGWTTGFTATDYIVVRGSRLITATTGGNIFKERNSNLDDLTLDSSLSKVARPGKFIVCGKEDGSLNRKLIYINGFNVPQGLVDDGGSMANISTPNADWDTTATNAGARPWTGCVHRDRVVVACPKGKDPHRLYFSSATNHGDFNTAGQATSRRVRSDTGDEIWGLASAQGVLWVWKYPVGIFYIDDSDLDATLWVERTKSQAVGCAPSPYAVCPMDDDVIFLSATGAFHVLSAVDTLGGVRASDLSWHLGLNKWLREHLNLSKLNQTLSVWYPNKKIALFAVPATGSNVNNLLLKWDFSGVESQEPVKFSYSQRDTPDSIGMKKDTDGVWKPVLGESVFVKKMEQDARNKDGVAYTGSVRTPHLDMSHLNPKFRAVRKLWEHLELIMEPTGTSTLTVQVYVDTVLRQTLTFDGNKRRHRKKLNVGDGHTISVVITNSVLNQDFKLLAALVYFKPGTGSQSVSS